MMTPFQLQRFTNLPPVELLFGVLAFSLVVWPMFWRRKPVSGSPVEEVLLQRVRELRSSVLPPAMRTPRKSKCGRNCWPRRANESNAKKNFFDNGRESAFVSA